MSRPSWTATAPGRPCSRRRRGRGRVGLRERHVQRQRLDELVAFGHAAFQGTALNSNTNVYGNAASGSMSVSGSGSDSYNYTENFTFTPGGQWLAASGTGSSSGSGSVTAGYSASGGYSSVDPQWNPVEQLWRNGLYGH